MIAKVNEQKRIQAQIAEEENKIRIEQEAEADKKAVIERKILEAT